MREEGLGESKMKSANAAMGLKHERGVIEGEAVKDNVDVILSIIKKHDDENKMQFYPLTGKIVGSVASVKIPHIRKELKLISNDITIQVKAPILVK